MPIIKSAKKAARQAIKRKAKNEAIKKEINSARKAVLKNPTAENVSAAQSAYDKAFKKGLIKKNTASRRKAKVAKIAKVREKVSDGNQEFDNIDDAMTDIPEEEARPYVDFDDKEVTLPKEEPEE